MIKNKGLYFSPLGGSEEFGINLNLYVCDQEMLAIDCGIGFADERYPGIDLLLPDPQILQDHKKDLKGMIITHAHEDHIGAVAYLWDRFECPLYASPFTASVLRRKLSEQGLEHVPVTVVKPDTTITIGKNYTATFLPVSHSVPDGCAIFLETPYGNVLHSGDWNLDANPVIGERTEKARFEALQKKGVLAYIGDSTNAQVNGYAGSEKDVAKGMEAEFKNCTGKIAVTIFASNIGRLISIVNAAQKTGRSVALIGRSLHRMIACAHECGYLDDLPDFIDGNDIEGIPDDNLVIVATGSQGEHRAALARIARGDHRNIRFNKGDTVIFSSRSIPGNERRINTVKNDLIASGVNIITPDDTENTIHVSGHPCRDEISTMLQWVKPQCVIPVHGERVQLDAQARLAQECQITKTIVPNNGSVIQLAPDDIQIIDHVETGMLAVDIRRIIPATHQSITSRRKLQYSGAIHASLVLNHDLGILGKAKIDTVGLSCDIHDDSIHGELEHKMNQILSDIRNDDIIFDEDEIAEKLRIDLRRYVLDTLGLKPKTTVHVTLLDI